MRIQQLSKLSGVSSTTIRFYEKTGVLPKASRGANGYREYPKEQIIQIQMIAQAKLLGFTLKEIKELSLLLYTQKLSPKEMTLRLKKKDQEIDTKIKNLKKIKKEIHTALSGLCEFKNRLTP